MGGSCDRPGCAPRVLCRRDLRGREGPLRGAGAEHPRGARSAGGESAGDGSGGVGVTGCGWEVARRLEPRVQRVIVVSPDDTGISSARAKTDKLDSRTLASLLWRGELDAVWMPDRCRIL